MKTKADKKTKSTRNDSAWTTLKTVFPYLAKHKWVLAIGFLFMLGQNYSYIQIPKNMQRIVDELNEANDGAAILSFMLEAIIFIAFMTVSMFMMRLLIIGVSRKIEHAMRGDIYKKFLSLDIKFYNKHQTGDLISRSTNDLDNVRTLLGPGFMYIPNSVSRLILFMPVMFALNRSLFTIIMGGFFVLISLIVILMPRLKSLYQRIQVEKGKINNHTWQIISGITTIKLFGLEKTFVKRYRKINQNYLYHNMRLEVIYQFIWPFFLFLFGLSELLTVWIGGGEVIKGNMSLGNLLQFIVMLNILTFPVLSLGYVLSLIQQGLAALGRINTILKEDVTKRYSISTKQNLQATPTANQSQKANTNASTNKGKKNVLQIRNLNYHYHKQQAPILNNISLNIEAGRITAITGKTGSGKTTLINLLTGVLDTPKNTIFFNGHDITQINPKILFEYITLISQETFLFSEAIIANIGFSAPKSISYSKATTAAKDADIHKDIVSFKDKYETLVGERGLTLSGGQKQRTSISRAIYKDNPIILFDDSLSSVDSHTEKNILNNIYSLKKDKTILIISHRISTLKYADVIYYLEKGEIIEQGNHQQLVSLGGHYAKIARLQELKAIITDK